MKKYLVISGIVGGMAGSIITVLLVLPVTAQHQHGKFRDIECNFLRLVDKDGKTRLILDPNGDSLAFHAEVFIGVDEYGGRVIVSGKDRESWASLGIHEHGGGISARGNYGKSWGAAELAINERGGIVQVFKGKSQAAMGINEYGNGFVSTWDKNGVRQ